MTIIDYLNDIDTRLFLFLNSIHSPFFDHLFYFVTGKLPWIPLYLFLIFLTALRHKWKTIYIGLFIGLLFTISDQTSVKLFKDVFERLRPCHSPEIKEIVHTLNGACGGKYGFVSSHASNSFALAVFIGQLLKDRYRYLFIALLLWAALVSYSRVYVGVHYPGDIIGGAILGSIVGFLVFITLKVVNKSLKLEIELR